MNMRSKNAFRAKRETLGITQQGLASLLGVKPLSIKRWELPKYPQQAPEEAWKLLEDLEAEQIRACTNAANAAQSRSETTGAPFVVYVEYWTSQAEYEASRGSQGISWTEANATSRRLAAILADRGAKVVWVDGSAEDE